MTLEAITGWLAAHFTEGVAVFLLGLFLKWFKSASQVGIEKFFALAQPWILAHVQNAQLQGFAKSVLPMVKALVEREAAKGTDAAKAAADGGKLPADVGKSAFDAVFADAQAQLGPLWAQVVGLIGEKSAASWLGAVIDEVVHKRNLAAQAAVAAADAPTAAKVVDAVKLVDAAASASDLAKQHAETGNAEAAAHATALAANLTQLAAASSADLVAQLTAATAQVAT